MVTEFADLFIMLWTKRSSLASRCRLADTRIHSITLDVSFEPEGGFDKMLLEILYGDRIRKTTERLNNEWLEKMWKVPDDDIRTFRSVHVYDF